MDKGLKNIKISYCIKKNYNHYNFMIKLRN